VTCELTLRDARSVARIVNLAYRFNCRCTRIDASLGDDGTRASFAFDGPATALTRLRAQIDRIMAYDEIDEAAG
jgi:hypothetical protein